MTITDDELRDSLEAIATTLQGTIDQQPTAKEKLVLQIAVNVLKAYPQLTLIEKVSINLIGAGMLKGEVAQQLEDLRRELSTKDLVKSTHERSN